MTLRIYDTLSRRKLPFSRLGAGPVGLYSCGPTVYARQHLGNMRPYVFADLLKRALRLFGHDVRHVINVTDVGHLTDDADAGDDKVERAARESASSALAIAEHWTALFQRDLVLLNVGAPDVWAKASEHIPEQLEMIARLERKGFVYALPDGLYFDTARDPHYGELAGLRASAEHSRVGGEKRNPADFAVWKLSPGGGPRRQLEWPSPWGTGFPGWHIECSAMAVKYLGNRFELHTGGIDHVPVHHTNEIAQSENALGVRPWVSYWMHGAWLTEGGEKISKSRGATLNLDDLRERGFSPGTYRYYLHGAHYRQPLAFRFEALKAASAALTRLGELAADPGSAPLDHPLAGEFRRALADDLNAPLALSTLWRIARDTSIARPERAGLLRELGGALGLELSKPPAEQHAPDPEIEALVHERELARRSRNFDAADTLREALAARGIAVEDTPEGPRWRRN